MAVLPIRLYPDPVLRERAGEVIEFDADLARLAGDMVQTMHAAPGVGLAANQVGVARRVAVVDVSVGEDPESLLVLVNPRIVEQRGEEVDAEGCLSIPDFTDDVPRPEAIVVAAQDVAGNRFTFEAEGFTARAVCHEVDHLDGVLFVDYLRGLRRERAKRYLRRLAREQAAVEVAP